MSFLQTKATSMGVCGYFQILLGYLILMQIHAISSANEPSPSPTVCSRWVPSQADVAVFEELSGAPDAQFVNVLRWFNQINSYSSDERLAYVCFGPCIYTNMYQKQKPHPI